MIDKLYSQKLVSDQVKQERDVVKAKRWSFGSGCSPAGKVKTDRVTPVGVGAGRAGAEVRAPAFVVTTRWL